MGPSQTHRYAGYLLLGMVALSLVVLSGWSGTVSLGQYAIVGVGAVVAGDLLVKLNLDLFAALGAAAAAGGVIGLVLGAPALRIKPMYVLVSSLAFAAAMDQFFLNPVNYPSWIPGDVVRPVVWKRYPLGSERAAYYLCLAALVLDDPRRATRSAGHGPAGSPSRSGTTPAPRPPWPCPPPGSGSPPW